MKTNMSNFFPMLSSSPPPIDDVDSPENDDEDDGFGIFASATNAFDCSFDSPSLPKDITSNGNLYQAKTINKGPSKVNTKHQDVSEIDPKRQNENCKDNESFAHFSNDIQNGVSTEETTAENIRCFSEPDVQGNVDCEDVLESFDSVSGPSISKSSSHISLCNNGVNTNSENPSEISENLHIEGESQETISPAPLTILSTCDEIVEDNFECESFSKNTIVNNTTLVNVVHEKSFSESNLVTEDGSHELAVSEHSFSPVENIISEKGGEKSASSVGSAQAALQDDPSCVTDIPDLTFIPFSNHNNGDNQDDFNEFREAEYCNGLVEEDLEDRPVAEDGDVCTSDADDDFGNFESGEPISCPVGNQEDPSDEITFDDFADFSDTKFKDDEHWVSEEPVANSSSQDFADFETASSDTQLKMSISAPKKEEKCVDKISTVISAVFPASESSAAECLCETNYEILDQNCKSHRLWERLHDTDQLPALPFQWGVSHSFQQLLRSVNVDYHSILRTSTVPFFASGLGLLEPTKGGTAKAESKNSDESEDFKDPIPPVHFDWGSSGLVNPLDSGQAISTLMDLTFLNRSGNSTPQGDSAKDFSFEDELLASQVMPPPESFQKAPILEHILSLGTKTSLTDIRSSSRPGDLSEETVRVLDQLPDLSFMRSQMLMFPISNET